MDSHLRKCIEILPMPIQPSANISDHEMETSQLLMLLLLGTITRIHISKGLSDELQSDFLFFN
jgi:hypothetical protein